MMRNYERLYDESERVSVQFVGITTEQARYDFSIVYTSMFFGKPLITCLQSGCTLLLSREDLQNEDYVKNAFKVRDEGELGALVEFFKSVLPSTSLEAQY